MSRIGRQPIAIPDKVKVVVDGSTVKVEGPRGKSSLHVDPHMKVAVADNKVSVTRQDDSRTSRSLHGLTRSLVSNMLYGVTPLPP